MAQLKPPASLFAADYPLTSVEHSFRRSFRNSISGSRGSPTAPRRASNINPFARSVSRVRTIHQLLMITKISINVTRVSKDRLFKGKNGTYLNAVLIRKEDAYGNAGVIIEDTTQAEREAGVSGKILGNWKEIGAKSSQSPVFAAAKPANAKPAPALDDEILPF